MERKYLAFDIETAKVLPQYVQNEVHGMDASEALTMARIERIKYVWGMCDAVEEIDSSPDMNSVVQELKANRRRDPDSQNQSHALTPTGQVSQH